MNKSNHGFKRGCRRAYAFSNIVETPAPLMISAIHMKRHDITYPYYRTIMTSSRSGGVGSDRRAHIYRICYKGWNAVDFWVRLSGYRLSELIKCNPECL